MGNGLLTFINEKYEYNDFFNKNEIIFYKNINDLNKKILYFKNKPKLLKKIASNGCKKAHKIFNNKLISDFIVKKSMDLKIYNNLSWMDE
jgi:spore maturation protein CgeB